MSALLPYFPLGEPRAKQILALRFIEEKIVQGYSDIVVAAPTGVGKSALGICASFWAAACRPVPPNHRRGSYYLVTQKLLQDQITNDIGRYREECRNCASIKSAEEYECPTYGNCGVGRRLSNLVKAQEEERGGTKLKRCHSIDVGSCAYRLAKDNWKQATASITNYPFFFTSRLYTADLTPRQLIVLDEAHGLEEQVIRFIDGAVSLSQAKKWLGLASLPDLKTMPDYLRWLREDYLPRLVEVYDELQKLEVLSENVDDGRSKDVLDLDKYICKLRRALAELDKTEENWVFWREEARGSDEIQYVVRPVFGAPFVANLVQEMAPIRLYMSAYPGVRDVFCRNLGLDPERVAWANLGSDFPVANRRVHFYPMGHMSVQHRAQSTPRIVSSVLKIADKRAERGLIHCNSYELGLAIEKALLESKHAHRVLFPKNADAREQAFKTAGTIDGAILISPSMTEGFDFAGDLARWQILAKIGFPYLGDKQVARKMELDPDWYVMRTVMTTVQACGRICRSSTDYGVTFILDSDFKNLWYRAYHMWPSWFKDSVVFHD